MPYLPQSLGGGAPSVPNVPGVPGVPSVPGFSDPTGLITQYAQQNLVNVADPMVASSIASIQQAAQAEGLSLTSNETLARVQTLFSQYKSLYGALSTGGYANAASIAIGAARQYVSSNSEVSGALATVQGLVTAFQRASSGASTPQDVAAAFSGPLIGAAVAAGAVSAGVGAAIVGAVAVAASLLDAAGFMASKPGVQVCPAFKYTGGGTPDFSIACMAVFDFTGSPISPGSTNWRSFPNPKNAADAWWFQPMPAEGTFTTWRNAKWIPEPESKGGIDFARQYGLNPNCPDDFILSPINAAFGQWWWIAANCTNSNYAQALTQARDASPLLAAMSKSGWLPNPLSNEQKSALLAFDGAYAKAWESNCEYWLNGHRGAAKSDGSPDGAAVLLRAASLWNRAHLPGQGVAISWPGADASKIGQELTALFWSFDIEQAVNGGNTDILTPDRTKLFLHTGPLRTAVKPPPISVAASASGMNAGLRLQPVALPKYTSSSTSPASTLFSLLATVGVGALGFFGVREFLRRRRGSTGRAPAAPAAPAPPNPSPPA